MTGERGLLRFSTAGSVDDGKSTLIGRLLYEASGVFEDQLAAVKNSKVNRSTGAIDFSLITDGLKAEREQGITIDVAYRYFATPRRKFIIADTPGHEQYTRNMATGASTAELAVVLIDARKGVLPQSRRHAYIAALLGITHVLVAVNKMDLVEFSREVFEQIEREFRAYAESLGLRLLHFIPISALDGDNVVERSSRTPWYEGPPVLGFLEQVSLDGTANRGELRFPVQYVIRPSLDFRGYAGTVASGAVRPGDTVMALPSGRITRVKSIPAWDAHLGNAGPGAAVTVCLADEIDLSRGDMLIDPHRMPHVSRRLEARLVWMHPDPLEVGRPYLLKHTTRQVPAVVTQLRHRVDVTTLEEQTAETLQLNEIGRVAIETTQPLYFDAYRRNRATGSFILIDPAHNGTVAAGMLEEPAAEPLPASRIVELETRAGRVTPAERQARNGHLPATVWLTARRDLAHEVERALFDRGCQVTVLADETESHLLPEAARMLNDAGLIAICVIASEDAAERDRARGLLGTERFVEFDPRELAADDEAAARAVVSRMEQRGMLRRELMEEGEGI